MSRSRQSGKLRRGKSLPSRWRAVHRSLCTLPVCQPAQSAVQSVISLRIHYLKLTVIHENDRINASPAIVSAAAEMSQCRIKCFLPYELLPYVLIILFREAIELPGTIRPGAVFPPPVSPLAPDVVWLLFDTVWQCPRAVAAFDPQIHLRSCRAVPSSKRFPKWESRASEETSEIRSSV